MPRAVHPVTGFSKEISDDKVADFEQKGWHVNGANAAQAKPGRRKGAAKKAAAAPAAELPQEAAPSLGEGLSVIGPK